MFGLNHALGIARRAGATTICRAGREPAGEHLPADRQQMALAASPAARSATSIPSDPAELKKALDLRGMRIASRWYSSFLLTRPFEEEEKDFIANLDFLAAVGANRINAGEQSYSIQGKMDVPGAHRWPSMMDDAEWKLLCDGLNKLGKIAADRASSCASTTTWAPWSRPARRRTMMANTDPRYVPVL